MINWTVRIKSKAFWLAVIPATLLLVQTVGAVFGWQPDFGVLQGQLLDIVNAVFLLLTILGIVVDPTTAGWSDSALAMTYDKPRLSDRNAIETVISTTADGVVAYVNEAEE